jgi:hypothetical protein
MSKAGSGSASLPARLLDRSLEGCLVLGARGERVRAPWRCVALVPRGSATATRWRPLRMNPRRSYAPRVRLTVCSVAPRNIRIRRRRRAMVENVRSVLVGLTKQSGENEPSSALAYGLSLAEQTGAHLTVQAASLKLILIGGWVSTHAQDLVSAENLRLGTLAEAVAESARSRAASAGVVCTTETPQLTYPDLAESFVARGHSRRTRSSLLRSPERPRLLVPVRRASISGWSGTWSRSLSAI